MTATQHKPGRTGRDSDAPASTTPRRRWGRPTLYTSYGQEMALLNTRAKQLGVLAIIAVAAYLPLTLEDDLLALLGTGLVLAIGAIGLNLLIGYAGQVSLGHAFFVGVGAYTAAVLAGDPDGRYLGFGVSEAPVWIVAAGVVAALFGVVGVELGRYKLIAFTISSFFAGVCGSLLYAASGQFSPEQFGLLLSVQFIAMVLIGGVATISGSIMGALLISMLPRLSSELPGFLPFVSSSPTDHPNVFEVEVGLYGALIVAFLLFEPRGLYGIWLRIRTYWKSFPFSY